MAVPATGTITMLGLAQEVAYGTYGSGTLAHAIRMSDLINGGGQNFFPDIQTGCIPNPHTRNALTLTNVYTSDDPTPTFTLYYNSSIGVANQLSVNDFLFTDSALTTPADSGELVYLQNSGSASTQICSTSGELAIFVTDSTGKITSIVCDAP